MSAEAIVENSLDYKRLLGDAVFIDVSYYNCLRDYTNPESVIRLKNKKWTVYVMNSGYITGLKLTMGKEDYNLAIDSEMYIAFVGKSSSWDIDPDYVKENFTDEFLSSVLNAVKADNNLGSVQDKKSGTILWNFHNYQIYYKWR